MLSVRIQKKFDENTSGEALRDDKNRSDAFILDIEFTAPPGITILFGASGSGKTTTLKVLSGLVKPDAGMIRVGDQVLFDSTRRIDIPVSERHVGYVFQNLALLPHLTALANIEFGIREGARQQRRAQARAWLENFGIGRVGGRLPRHISGGEAQRVALARALASRPRILLLDEPLSALDETTKLGLIADLKKINRELRLPVVYVTHSREEAFALGERALIFERGRVVAEGVPEEVFGAPVRASVARLAGIENIFEGMILPQRDAGAATMLVELEGAGGESCRIEVPLAPESSSGGGRRVTVGVRSGDILLSTEEPRGLSARNILAGRITAVEERGSETLVRVACGVEWVSSVTKQSIAELNLAVGQNIWIVFKTYSCRIFDREG